MKNINNTILAEKKHIHFIGIGGSGMFPIVQILHSKGYFITGSDNNESDTVNFVRQLGINVYLEHRSENILGADLIIFSAAIMKDNVELLSAIENNIQVIERGKILGIISSLYNRAICVSGTHGKTTTSAMITNILENAKLNPTSIIGGRLPKINGNGKTGCSDILVCEACEFADTFLNLDPNISIILNLDEDHLEYFKNLDNIIKSFNTFCSLTSDLIIVNGDDKNSMQAVNSINKKIITFGFNNSNNYYPENIKINSDYSISYDLNYNGKKICNIKLNVSGKHNVLNSIAACIACIHVGVSPEHLSNNISDFTGVARRFEILGNFNGITIIDDYAHHPLEIEMTLSMLRNMNYRKIWAIFQPFTYSRTYLLLDDFVKSLLIADNIIITDIMAAREKNTYNIHAVDLASKIPNCIFLDTFDKISEYVKLNANPGDAVITLGCGDIYKVCKKILNS